MVRPRRVARLANRRIRKRRARPSRPSAPSAGFKSVLSNVFHAAGLRTLTVYPRPVDSEGKPDKTGWLEAIKYVGTVALKMFLTFLATSEEIEQAKTSGSANKTVVPLFSLGVIYLGPEDILSSSAEYVTNEKMTWTVPKAATAYADKIPFRSGRFRSLELKVVPTPKSGVIAGRYAVAILPLNMTEVESMWYGGDILDEDKNKWIARPLLDLNFDLVASLPGAIISPASSVTRITWRPKPLDFGGQFQQMGSEAWYHPTLGPPGGWPVVKILFAVENHASRTPDPIQTLSPEFINYSAELRGRLEMRDPGHVWIRSAPITSNDSVLEKSGKKPMAAFYFKEQFCRGRANEIPMSDLSIVGGELQAKLSNVTPLKSVAFALTSPMSATSSSNYSLVDMESNE